MRDARLVGPDPRHGAAADRANQPQDVLDDLHKVILALQTKSEKSYLDE